MKPAFKIVANLITAYFLALPFLLGFHSLQHEHHSINGSEDGIEVHITTDCMVCDVLMNQSLILEVPPTFGVDLAVFQPQAVFADLLKEHSFQFIYLRGPPSLG